ncbi:hypothetical protein ZWY2020_026171 [Hordeum vulgare]|nr:hypothetical protein ZWY2020_026168 [Hordeum vulgare]KAI5001521.1 hypothetical protein ZWY2020_026171 [Hordeum vulgare]
MVIKAMAGATYDAGKRQRGERGSQRCCILCLGLGADLSHRIHALSDHPISPPASISSALLCLQHQPLCGQVCSPDDPHLRLALRLLTPSSNSHLYSQGILILPSSTVKET